ncbi:hypothetical protein GGI43DRAFT_388490 [Trichoderma evansii]
MDISTISGNTFGQAFIVQGSINAVNDDRLRREREIEILRRLYKSPYEGGKNRNPDRALGTCEWFVAHKLFQEWQESKRSTTLWVSADPGCGKSVLAKHLIDSVLPNTASRTTCYFFFKDDFEDQKNVISALCCILHQLFKQKRILLSEAILDEFEIYQEEITGSFGKLWNTLLSAAENKSAGEIVCLLDAIDECEDGGRAQLARALQKLYNTGKSFNLKFFLTSRPYANIRHGFRPLDIPELAVIHLSGESDVEMKKISEEIDTFIQAKVQAVGEKLALKDGEQDLLLQQLMRVPNRTYLWVHLTLDLIEHDLDLDKTKIVTITSHLPNTVEEAYERILSRGRNLEEAKKLLHIVVAAARPLTLNEMNLALTLRNHHHSYFDLYLKSEKRFQDKGIFDSEYPQNIFKHIHGNPKWKQSLWPHESHLILAEICIWHLLFTEFGAQSPDRRGMISQYADNHVFLDYSAEYWTTHVRESHIEINNSLGSFGGTQNTDFPQNFTALMIASYFGLTPYQRSALSWAAGNGHHAAVKLLIKGVRGRWKGIKLPFKVGAQVNSVDRHDLTPLSYAVLNGHVAAAELLLKAGARVDIQDNIGGTPLSYAVCNGHENMINILFKRGINIGSEEDISAALLLPAAEKGHEGIVKLLLDRGRVDPDSRDKNGNTPLYMAVKNGHQPIVKLLLETPGDKITITEEVVKAAAGAERNGEEVMTLLLDQRGGQITITEEVVKAAAENKSNGKEVMTLLLNRGGDEIIVTKKILKAAAGNSESGEEIIALLFDQRGDQTTIKEETVLLIAAEFNEKVMTILLDKRGDQITITEKILEAAAGNMWNSKEVMTLLLSRRGYYITITEEIVSIIAAKFDEKMMTLLLSRRGNQITITEKILKAAAGNYYNGKDMMALLLNRQGYHITITEEVLKAAAGNSGSGREIIALLLNK